MKGARDVIHAARHDGTTSLAFHIAVEEMALQRDMLHRALSRLLEAVTTHPAGTPVSESVTADARGALEFCDK